MDKHNGKKENLAKTLEKEYSTALENISLFRLACLHMQP